ncbi:MAG TPA: PH domain-containing protein [Microcella sp.]|nr:PH domain-containing protein [Microcella sp.]
MAAAVAVWMLAAAIVIASLLAGPAELAQNAPLAGGVAMVGWAALWRPSVCVDDEAVELHNVTHTARIPWDAVIDVDTKYALSIRTPRALYSAWAAPAPGRFSSRVALKRGRRKASAEDGDPLRPTPLGERTSDLPSTDSGDAALIVRARWQRLLDEGRIRIGEADAVAATRTWHIATMAVTLGLFTTWVALAFG